MTTVGDHPTSTLAHPPLSTDSRAFRPAQLTENAQVVVEKRYLRKDESGLHVENAQDMFRRVANALAEPDRRYGANEEQVRETADAFFRCMASLEYLPNSPTLMNAGTGAGTLSACFVLPLTDSMEGIMGAAHDAAMVQKYGGGTGFALSELRQKGAHIKTTHGKACGPVAVLRHLSSVSTLVTQGGKRDGANMAVMDVHHPDVMEFIHCKQVEGDIHNFNISVGVSDEFMQAVEQRATYPLRAPEIPGDPESKMVEVGRLDAVEVFEKIVRGAWRNGEPGMIFLDEVNRNSPVLHVGRITATNPCGEQPLLANESCNLGSIDLSKFVAGDYAVGVLANGATPGEASVHRNGNPPRIEWDRLERTVRTAVHMLDNVIDANQYAVAAIRDMTFHTRKIGLGIMGFADMLIQLGIPYDSQEAIEIGRKLMRFIKEEADAASSTLANGRGPYPAWYGSAPQRNGDTPMRNACRLTVAPTGTISMIAGCSSGIEPIFSLAFRKHNILEGQTLYYVDRNLERVARERGFYSEELMEYLSDGGSLLTRDDVPDDVKDLFHVSADISPENHVLMQAAFQASTDSGISKTINFPNSATVEDVERAYLLAWRERCKGITVYRAGSREKEVLTSGHSDEPQAPDSGEMGDGVQRGGIPQYVTERERPTRLYGMTQRVRTGRGNLFVTINMSDDGRPFEVFATHGKAGGNDAAMAEAVSRLASLSIRSGVDPRDVITQLRGITDVPAWDQGDLIRSVPDAIALVIEKVLEEARSREVLEPGKTSHPALSSGEAGQLAMLKPPSAKELGMPSARQVSETSALYTAEAAPVMTAPEAAMMEALRASICPDCHSPLAHEEGCVKCHSCGFSKC